MKPIEIKTRKYFSKAQKLKILFELDSEFTNCSELARKHDIHPVKIYSWKSGLRDMVKDKKEVSVQGHLAVDNLVHKETEEAFHSYCLIHMAKRMSLLKNSSTS